MKPKFIVVDGGDGTGKSTLLEAVKKTFPEDSILFVREPGGSPFAEVIRDVALKNSLAKEATPLTQFSLMWAARHDLLTKGILPAMKAGKSVVSDRFDICTFAYQVYGSNIPHLEDLFWKTRDCYLADNKPDLYIVLDLDPVIGRQRTSGRANSKPGETNHFDERPLEFHQRVRNGYLDFAKKVPNVKIVDASQTPEKVKEDFLKIFKECLSGK